jgi:23S rRNA (uracil1939-C5)-methyltransferase
MGKIKKNFLLENLEVVDTTSEGKAVARHEGLVVFVEGAVPGDVVDVMVHRKKNSFAEGKVHAIKTPSKNRVPPTCEHFGTCGGCKWQHFDYEAQLHFKQKTVQDALERVAKVEFPEIQPIIGNASPYFYRNKLEYSYSNKKWLTLEQIQDKSVEHNRNACGFHIPGFFDKVLDIHFCHLQNELSNAVRNTIKDYALKNEISFFDIRDKKGCLRTLMIRTTSTGETMVLLGVYEYDEAVLFSLLEFVKQQFPQITSLLYTHSHKANDSLTDLEIKVFAGRNHITEEMEGLKFNISAKSFYQTNSLQAFELYKITRRLAGLTGNELVYDLYTGTGTIANFVAKQAKQVIGIEYVADAIVDAKANSKLNGITNTLFYAGDMKDILNDAFIQQHGKPDVIITDPPRAGMHEDVIKVMINASPQKIVYVSCNPATQARDLSLLDANYKVTHVQPVDMFPQTAHVENVVLLEKR